MTSHDCDPDHDVLSLMGNGNKEGALRLLMQRHGRDVYQICRRVLRDSTLAEDVQQQVFLSAYQDLSRFAGRSRFRTWLLGIAYHRSLDALRSRRRRELREVELTEIHDPRPSALESMDDMQLRVVLNGILSDLGEPARVAVLLRFRQEHTFKEMAAICDEDAAVLRNRVSRALRRIRLTLAARSETVRNAPRIPMQLAS